jgi:poly(3-hydroxybutyrate) depolymerase
MRKMGSIGSIFINFFILFQKNVLDFTENCILKIMNKILLGICLLLAVTTQAQVNLADSGKQYFMFSDGGITKKKPLKVWYYSPSKITVSLPIVIMLHGAKRNPSAYLDDWMEAAKLFNCIVVAPEFSQEDYPKADNYNLGSVYDAKKDKFRPSNEWSFSVIEPLFDYVKQQTGNISKGYYLSGHSAGSQFVHRFLFFEPKNRVIRAMAANAGWYTLPDLELGFPFGLKNSPVTTQDLIKTFATPVIILLGEADLDRTSADFNTGGEYDKQGMSRFERGNFFYTLCQNKARSLHSPFNWTLATVPGVAHSNKELSKYAAAFFFMNVKSLGDNK